ncbi:t-SNARE domain-containing protein 1 [Gadus macrocephalus]|uniref:t-SNARE domain-containing protein 1 n=1 Tax=Gadus macrocephalus TaxID=80720 RepID=UPI0028CBA034|nr:t-SNARE domain-containing protein 1 [Gadus macrocephalus]
MLVYLFFQVVTLEKSLQSLGTSRDTAELRQSLHATQQQTNKVITSTSQLIKQLSDIISSSSRQDRLRLTRLKTELSESSSAMQTCRRKSQTAQGPYFLRHRRKIR